MQSGGGALAARKNANAYRNKRSTLAEMSSFAIMIFIDPSCLLVFAMKYLVDSFGFNCVPFTNKSFKGNAVNKQIIVQKGNASV